MTEKSSVSPSSEPCRDKGLTLERSALETLYVGLLKPFNSQIKFVILLTVNHTILIMLVQRI